jgi:hypothetical protein
MTCWCREEGPQFPRETGCREAALILLKEKGLRYTPLREPLLLGRCVLCWEQEWDDCFEVTEFNTKESFIFKVRRALPVWTMILSSKPPPPSPPPRFFSETAQTKILSLFLFPLFVANNLFSTMPPLDFA